MVGKKFSIHNYIGAGSAEVRRGPFILAITTEELNFNGNREILVDEHGFGIEAMQHRSAVPDRPAGAAGSLVTNKPIFNAEQVITKFFFVEYMTKFFGKIRITIIHYF